MPSHAAASCYSVFYDTGFPSKGKGKGLDATTYDGTAKKATV